MYSPTETLGAPSLLPAVQWISGNPVVCAFVRDREEFDRRWLDSKEGFATCISWQNPEQETLDLDIIGSKICFDGPLPPAALCPSKLFLEFGHGTCRRSEVFGPFSLTHGVIFEIVMCMPRSWTH